MPNMSLVDALLTGIEAILTRHSVDRAYIERGTTDQWIVVCRCRMRFDAGESHAIHQTRVIRGWLALQAAHHVTSGNGMRELN